MVEVQITNGLQDMIPAGVSTSAAGDVQIISGPQLADLLRQAGRDEVAEHPAADRRWLAVLRDGLGHEPFLLRATDGDRTVGELPLAYVRSLLFGRYLVSLPYINSSGVRAESETVGSALIDRAIALAGELNCRFLELRHEQAWPHPALNGELTSKVHMRLPLPETPATLWDGLKAKVRNQVRKGQQQGFTVHWGGADRLEDFYAVFSRNMRDLGTPVYGESLFRAILAQFDDRAEFCTVHDGPRCIAAALLVHGGVVTEVPSASSLREYNSSNANMLLYWHLLERSVQRGQRVFDFGRSTRESNTFRFKKQWGAEPQPAVWQYHLRQGSTDALRPDNAHNQRLIRIWQRLPVPLTRLIGPRIIRGIP